MRIALLCHGVGPGSAPAAAAQALELARGLSALGHQASVVGPPDGPGGGQLPLARQLADGLLARRGFPGSLTGVPLGAWGLAGGGFDVAHAFSATDALAALTWRRVAGGPVAFTCTQAVAREDVADRRLRSWLLARAVEDADSVIASTDEVRAALWRWLAADAPVIPPGDASGHERMYRELLARRG